jgi:tetratricopeptide (TPR) repeat protein
MTRSNQIKTTILTQLDRFRRWPIGILAVLGVLATLSPIVFAVTEDVTYPGAFWLLLTIVVTSWVFYFLTLCTKHRYWKTAILQLLRFFVPFLALFALTLFAVGYGVWLLIICLTLLVCVCFISPHARSDLRVLWHHLRWAWEQNHIRQWISGAYNQTLTSPKGNKLRFAVLVLLGLGLIWAIESATSLSLELSSLLVLNFMLLVLAGVFTLVYHIYTRHKYVVMPFEVTGVQEEELKALAHLVTNTVVQELQTIGELLSLRQVENATDMVSDDAYALLMTSGEDQGIIRQMDGLANLEVAAANVTFPLGSLVSALIYTLAKVRVRGSLQRRRNNTVELWIELNLGGRRTVAVDSVFIPENSTNDLDEVTVDTIIRQLVVELIIETGEGIHLPTTQDGFDYFLQGLEASSQRRWWTAISYYRKAIEIEEALRGHFGVGHYHLGAALIFQKDLVEGERHLRLAEQTGPPLAETQYMLALVTLFTFWDELFEISHFMRVERRCKTALSIRPDFPEARHLLGVAYYRRARLNERDSTRLYDINAVRITAITRKGQLKPD